MSAGRPGTRVPGCEEPRPCRRQRCPSAGTVPESGLEVVVGEREARFVREDVGAGMTRLLLGWRCGLSEAPRVERFMRRTTPSCVADQGGGVVMRRALRRHEFAAEVADDAGQPHEAKSLPRRCTGRRRSSLRKRRAGRVVVAGAGWPRPARRASQARRAALQRSASAAAVRTRASSAVGLRNTLPTVVVEVGGDQERVLAEPFS